MPNRAKAEKYILGLIEDLQGKNSASYQIYVKRFAEMSDEKFHEYMLLCKEGKEILPVWVPNMHDDSITTEGVLAAAKKRNFPFFQRIWLTDQKTGQLVLRDRPTRLYLWANRRQAQTREKKIHIPKNNNTKDALTNQPTGDSKGSSWSQPEMQATQCRKMPNVNRELAQVRGGNDTKFNAMTRAILETGTVSLDQLPEDGQVKSTVVAGVIMTAMHFENNLAEG